MIFLISNLLGANAFDSDKAFEIVHNTSSLTHAHPIALIGCDIYVAILLELLHGCKKEEVRIKALPRIGQFVNRHPEYQSAIEHYSRIIHMIPTDLTKLEEKEIKSSGYVVDTLEAALWAFFTTNSYKECLLKAVNLGYDADSVGAVTGGLAGLYYYTDEDKKIPDSWMEKVRGKKLLDTSINDFAKKFF